ncbi:hypothetical protein GCM10022261_20980 [Brevibacterium daeguense]|uniref:HTH luxR-type domain-containing protein n=1 Tax=Brevibacterium daeguense TaxID=909936 RepID=A0ABP8EKU1_9MICO|nr:LuxR C-terminal-related transcriptional regulator [Brevibacterium daeguense]
MRSSSRRSDLTRLRSLVDDHINAAVVGKHGTGKTSLLQALAEESEARTVFVPVNPTESGLANSGLAVLAASLRPVEGGLLSREVEELLSDDGPASVIAESLIAAIRAVDASENVLILVDGADQLDGRSQLVLGYLLRRVTSGPLRFVISIDGVDPSGAFVGVQTVELKPLELVEMVDLAQRQHPGLSDEAAYCAARASSGHLLALEHILELMNERQRSGSAPLAQPLRTSRAIDGLVFDCLGDISEDSRKLLKCLAVAPRTSIRPLLKIVPSLWEELEELESRDIIDRVGPHVHIQDQLVRCSIYWSMTAGERSELHSQMERNCSSFDRSMSIWHGSFVGDEDDTPATLLEIARDIVIEGKPHIAVEFAERALVLSPDASAIAAPLLELAESLLVHGDFVFTRRYIRLARRSARSADIRLRAARLALEIEFLETQSISSEAVTSWRGGDTGASPAQAAALRLQLSACHAERWELAEAEEDWKAAHQIFEQTGVPATPAAESVRALIDGFQGRADSALKLYSSQSNTGSRQDEMFGALAVARNLIYTEHYEEARFALSALELAAPPPTIFHESARLSRVELEFRAGNIHRAALILAQPRQFGTEHQVRGDLELLLRCWLMLHEGRAVEVEPMEQELVRLAGRGGNRSLTARLSALQGTFLLRHGLAAEALRHLQRCEELGGGGQPNPNLYRHEPELIEALLKVGRREHAVLVLQRFRKRLERCPSRWGELAALRCDALVAVGEKSVEPFRRALRAFRLGDSDHEKARTLAAFAQRLSELGMKAESREQMLNAAALYRETGDHATADLLTPAAPALAAAPARPHPLLSQLSEEEQAVVELVREGYRNREIAEKIFVSLRTVEIRLTGVYRKFGVRSRTELIARLSEADVVATG